MNANPDPRSAIHKTSTHTARSVARQVACTARPSERRPDTSLRLAWGGPVQVLRYLGRYTHRVAISNHRLLSFDGERVTFRWKDYAHGSQPKIMTLTAIEFQRRFFLHVLPKGFVRISHFGCLANRFRANALTLGRKLLATTPPSESQDPFPPPQETLWHCPHCGAVMVIVQRFER